MKSWIRSRLLPLGYLLSLLATVAANADADRPVDESVLAELVTTTVLEQAQARYGDTDITVSVSRLDSRIKLAACAEITVEPRGQRRVGRVPISVSCAYPSWNVFMTATVTVMQSVVVTQHALPRGTLLTTARLTTELRDLKDLRKSHFTNPADILGMELKRPLAPGGVLYASMLKVPIAIRRGDKVSIVASRGSINISVPGESLENGMLGEQIRVRNRQSEKIVHAWVRRAGVVSTTADPAGNHTSGRQIADLH